MNQRGGHRFLKFLLPAKLLAAVRAGTKEWLAECSCGHKQDYWDAGGVRYKATGEPRQVVHCPACGKSTVHRIRKKTPAEREAIP